MLRSSGFSLLEVMISLASAAVVALGLFSLALQFQKWSSNLDLLVERDENLRLAPLLLSRYLQGAGNERWGGSWEGLTIEGNRLQMRSDSDGPEGFPDSQLQAPFESVALRHQGNELKLKSGQGTFQPLLRQITGLDEIVWEKPLLTLQMRAATARSLADLGRPQTESVCLSFFLWNYRPNLFPERLP